MGLDSSYIPTEDERRVLKECRRESFWYRALPYSLASMSVTLVMIARGTLTASPRFGALPKVAFAGLFGYLTGKISYVKKCEEKFRRLENSPLGEALRQRVLQHPDQGSQSELGDPPERAKSPYDDLRTKNRERYEVTQKPETLVTGEPEPGPDKPQPKKEVKNIYGDIWQE